jgi:ABC-2 type transport system permease protein
MSAFTASFTGGAIASWALLQRDMRAFLRARSQFYSSVLLPLMLLAILGTGVSDGLNPTSRVIRDGDYISYLAPGMIALTALFSSTFSSASFYRDRDSGMLRTLLASPHSTRTILFGKSLAAITIGSIQAILILIIAVAIPGIDFAWQYGWLGGVALVVAGILAMNFLLSGLSLLVATRIRTMQGFHLVMNLILFPLFFLSGAFFPLDALPDWLRVLGLANPLTYPVDLMQTAAYAGNNSGFIGPEIDFAVLGGLALVIFVLGMRRAPSAT